MFHFKFNYKLCEFSNLVVITEGEIERTKKNKKKTEKYNIVNNRKH